ncbi:DUF226 domain-containing protein (plasmid) [Borrelia miyamotoi]|uniref:DUF226 domain-containing protein n=1 Tax=Borrelia miyamotoi TaxID=47466 RepID=A0A5P8AV32_9SPIR|nr:DUF226 domain-containing protein [Borrelia miyamotoi]QFP42594.1 DUF226 domain-containing protein [Borrelia miyamotoi]WAZ72516.1 DUF226 domain-containing protein [Borrelia miyamotoi]WVI05683.1 DUF226 domain-containing protein [Borrelia miyamotoi]
MESALERLKEKKLEIKGKKNKLIFVKVESKNNRTLYHTKMMNDLYTFGIHRRQSSKFFIAFRGLFNKEKITPFNLFSIKGNDKFLGIFYGYRKPVQNVVTRYEENGVIKSYTFSKVYYIEFRFKKGSVFCYLKGIFRLIKKEKSETHYSQFLLKLMMSLEKQVYEFYGKKFPSGGIITKWIEKKLRS